MVNWPSVVIRSLNLSIWKLNSKEKKPSRGKREVLKEKRKKRDKSTEREEKEAPKGMAAGLYDITSEVLGKGHFAVVKLARHCLTSELVAVKIIDKTKLNKEGLLQQSQEVRILSRLSQHEHPNIVKLYQVIDTKSKLYLVMEYCGRDVCDLYDYIQKKLGGSGLEESEAKHIFRQICSAIAYCHSLRIVHRDLKPENLLILTQPVIDGQSSPVPLPSWPRYPMVKLIDFGFANQWVEGVKLRTSCGSLAYSAPEILLGDQYDGDKVDIWGLGCILYILLYGNNPFMQINDNETLCRILDCNFATPARSNISCEAIDLIKALLKKDPNSRLTMNQVMTNRWFDDLLDNNVTNYHYPHYSKNRSSPSHHHGSSRTSTRSPSTVVASPSPPVSAERRPSMESKSTSSNVPVPRPSVSPQVSTTVSSRPSAPTSSRGSASVKSPPSSSPSPPPIGSNQSFSLPPSVSEGIVESKNGTSTSDVHDRVIDQMITQKMAASKECVERALKSSRVSSGSNRSSLSSLSNLPVVEEVVVDQECGRKEAEECVPIAGVVDEECGRKEGVVDEECGMRGVQGQRQDPSRSRSGSTGSQQECENDSYISATYNLLKDKILREMQGIPSSSNVHEIRTSHKRGHILPGRVGRKPGVSKPPMFNRPLDEMSLQQNDPPSDPMVEEPDDGFVLPLQRKCSIVSEEGSLCELSGRLSHSGSDLHTFLVGDGKEPVVVKGPSVDIVITDFSDDPPLHPEHSHLVHPTDLGTVVDTTDLGTVIDTTALDEVSTQGNQGPTEPVDVNDNLDLAADVDLTCINDDSPTSQVVPPGTMPTTSQGRIRGGSVGTKFKEVSPPNNSTISVPGTSPLLLSQKHFVSSSPDLSRQGGSYGILEEGVITVSNIMDMKDLPAIDDVFATDDQVTMNDPNALCRTRTSTMNSSRHESVPVATYVREGYVRDNYGRDSGCGAREAYVARDAYASRDAFSKDQVVDDVGDHVLASRQGRRRGSKTTSGSSADSYRRDVGSPPDCTNVGSSGRSSITEGQGFITEGQGSITEGQSVTFELSKSCVNPRPSTSTPGPPTSLRIITQSKSCTNILSSAAGTDGANGGSSNGNGSRNGSRKGSRRSRDHLRPESHRSSQKSSMDSNSSNIEGIKDRTRTDCCTIS